MWRGGNKSLKKRWEGSRMVGKLRDGEEIRKSKQGGGGGDVEEEAGKGKVREKWNGGG